LPTLLEIIWVMMPQSFLKRFPFRGNGVGLWFVVPAWMMVLVPLAGVPIMGKCEFFLKVGIA